MKPLESEESARKCAPSTEGELPYPLSELAHVLRCWVHDEIDSRSALTRILNVELKIRELFTNAIHQPEAAGDGELFEQLNALAEHVTICHECDCDGAHEMAREAYTINRRAASDLTAARSECERLQEQLDLAQEHHNEELQSLGLLYSQKEAECERLKGELESLNRR